MIWVVVLLTAGAVSLLVMGVASIAPAQSRTVRRRLEALQTDAITYRELSERRRRQAKRERLEGLLEALGDRVGAEKAASDAQRDWLMHGGMRHPNAVAIFVASRIVVCLAVGIGVFFLGSLVLPFSQLWLFVVVGGLLGWMVPFIWVDRKVKQRIKNIRRALPDTLDLLVVCVESGLGLNQALTRVAEEVDRISPEMSDELTVTNLEIRAGTPRDEALRNLGERTGVDDLRALTSMLVQSDRFGTSIGDSLRIHADSLRTKRMQLAEEAAAKTTVKMLFPLIFFIFPAIFVVLLGPAVFLLRDVFGNM